MRDNSGSRRFMDQREELWTEMTDVYGLCSPAWCTGGDFNVVRNPKLKIERKAFHSHNEEIR